MYILVLGLLWGWGLRGHDIICQTSASLIKNEKFRNFMQGKAPTLGYLCNIPDTHWRSLGKEVNAAGAPTHFLDVDDLAKTTDEIPTKIDQVLKKFPSADLQSKTGSSWWRADQFFRLATASPLKLSPNISSKDGSPPPSAGKAELDALMYLGIMGHYVGDMSMPLHSSTDYDGWQVRHGGLHSYYESDVVAALSGSLFAEVLAKANEIKQTGQSFLKPGMSVVERMRALTAISQSDLPKLIEADELLAPSTVQTTEAGIEIKTKAKRKMPDQTKARFHKLIVYELARSSALMSVLFEEAYIKLGSPDLDKLTWYTFPHQPDFVYPDYFPASKKL